jgi:hypothetical protein
MVMGLIESVKSGVAADVGGGVSAGATCVVVPPPQAAINRATNVRIVRGKNEEAIDEDVELRTAVPPCWSKQGGYLTELFIYMSS